VRRVETTVQRITYELSAYEVRLAIRDFVHEAHGHVLKDGAPITIAADGSATVVNEFEKDAGK
jgi:hypothetical protein